MTIHSGHPFATDDDPVRRLRGRLGGAVTLWTAGDGDAPRGWAGLTVSSVMLAHGETPRLLALVDPDSDLADTVERTGRAVVHLLSWQHRDLADAFAGVSPAPGGPFRLGPFEPTAHGPLLADATSYGAVEVESAVEVGWSLLLTCPLDVGSLVVGDDEDALLHRRGRYSRLGSGA
ncbi:flavin reductase family protein [Nocardioides sp.]|uniref:flavin reductase family protein n=1 Tax=Nocardioides sp. TaxID=35761 RepID=UPI0027276445|nr:flavin reductase family protein [Nocardioides sp.]MDO9455059.1 flavin reductase family protein [Nocardioides sp.]